MKGRRDRAKTVGRYTVLTEWMLASAAWQSLDCNCRCLYIELARRYRGPDSNNGKIPFSVREAATVLRIGRSTADRCFDDLQERGFIRVGKLSGFNVKGRVSTEWLLTEFPDDRKVGEIATKDFMRWVGPPAKKPTHRKLKHSPPMDTHSPISGPGMALQGDRVALEQR